MLDSVIQKKISELPDNVRHAVETFDWASEILHIARDNQLQIDDVDIFRRETLLVIVGLTPAEDFEKNLSEHMGISHELGEKLVADANEHIFRPLQKIAFTHTDDDEVLEHEDLSEAMGEHGIELVDEFEAEPRPQNKLQNLADEIFDVKNNTKETKNIEDTKETTNRKNMVVNYNEPIHEKDLRGIKSHRIDTSILKHSNPEHVLQNDFPRIDKIEKTQSIDKHIFDNPHLSKNESFDVSPSREEQVVEDGTYLEHISSE